MLAGSWHIFVLFKSRSYILWFYWKRTLSRRFFGDFLNFFQISYSAEHLIIATSTHFKYILHRLCCWVWRIFLTIYWQFVTNDESCALIFLMNQKKYFDFSLVSNFQKVTIKLDGRVALVFISSLTLSNPLHRLSKNTL